MPQRPPQELMLSTLLSIDFDLFETTNNKMQLSQDIQGSIEQDDVAALHIALLKHPKMNQNAMNQCLKEAIPRASLQLVELLLQKGARMVKSSFESALSRKETSLFQLLQEYGFDLDTTEFGRTPVQ